MRKESIKSFLLDITKTAIVAAVIVIPLQTWFIKPYIVKQVSMLPTLQQYNYLMVNRWSVRRSPPERGDIVVFHVPEEKDALIKRVIGLPGETVEVKNKQVFINGRLLDESAYLSPTIETWGNNNLTLGPEEYFVLGDNRNHSQDSRYFGPTPRSAIVGRASVRLFPPGSITRFQTPSYQLY